MKRVTVCPDEVEVKLLSMYRHGYTYPQMSREVFISERAIRKRFERMRNFFSANNNRHLIEILREKKDESGTVSVTPVK